MGPEYAAWSGRKQLALSRCAGLVVACVGGVVCLAWLLRHWIPIALLTPMKFNTALCLMALGVGLGFEHGTSRGTQLRRALGAFVLLLGGTTLAEIVFAFDAQIDDPLGLGRGLGGPAPVRMAPITAINLTLGGLVLLLFDLPPWRWALQRAESLALLIGFNASVVILGHIYGATGLHQLGNSAPVAVHTAASLVVFAVGVTVGHPRNLLPQLFSAESSGGVLARRLLPAIAALPALLGWIQLCAVRAGLLTPHEGFALFAGLNVACVLGLALTAARAAHRAETVASSALRARHESEARKAAILDAALDCVVSMDEAGRITEFNAAAERTFGYARAEVVGRSLVEVLVPPRLREAHKAGLERYTRSGQPKVLGRRVELPALRADGTEFPVELAVVRIPSSGPAQFTGFIRDLSERVHAEEATAQLQSRAHNESQARYRAETRLRQTEERLRQSQKMEAIGRLAGGVAHDFNNMLSVIIGSASLLRHELSETHEFGGEVIEIEAAANRAAALTRQLLAFSRQQVLEPRVVDLNQLLLRLDGMLRRTIGEDVHLQVTTDPKLGRVLVDPGQIENVIVNLVVNARDAMPRGGTLRIESRQCEFDTDAEQADASEIPHAMISVSDDGVGMDAETLSRMFEPFFTTKDKDKGTGLGLAMVFGTVTQSGGHIGVESELSKGTTIKLYFPVTNLSPGVAQAHTGSTSSRGSEQVLLVEDEEQVRRVISVILRRCGYQVTEAKNAEEALQLALDAQAPIDLLLTDVVMPGMSGPDLAQRLRKTRAGLKVLCMSGYMDDAILRHGLGDTGLAYLQKPITPENLARKVRDVLDQSV